MKAPAFRYHAPTDVAQAVSLLASLENARVLAGGQSLMPMMNLRVAGPDHLIDLGRIPELAGVAQVPEGLLVGAMTTQRALETSAVVARLCPLLSEAVSNVGHQQTRNRGTIGGSLCHLDPGAELPVAAAALDAVMIARGPQGERRIAFADFPADYLTSTLEPGEILTHVLLPVASARAGSAFLEFNRRPADYAIVSVAAHVTLDEAGRVAGASIAVGGVSHAPVRLADAEAGLVGALADTAACAQAGRLAATLACDGDDLYPADYKQDLCETLVRRALGAAFKRAGAGHV